jgi:hypothetical protein
VSDLRVARLRKAYERAHARVEAAQAQRRAAVRTLQRACKHPVEALLRAAHMESKSGLFRTLPPLRVCTLCGLQEEEWGGVVKLATEEELPVVSRATLASKVLRA